MTNDKALELYKLAGFTLKKYNIPYDEDLIQELVVYAYSKNHLYNEEKGTWANFIIHCMTSKIFMINRHDKLRGRDVYTTISLDDFIDEENKLTYADVIIIDDNIFIDELHKKELLKAIKPLIEKPLELKLQGLKQAEIAKRCGVSQPHISRKIKENIRKIKIFCAARGLNYEL